jgi:hypothetical protein
VAEFGAENLLRLLGQVRLSFKGGKEQVVTQPSDCLAVGPQMTHKSAPSGVPPHFSHKLNGTMRHTAAQLLEWCYKPLTSSDAGEQGSPVG